MTKATAAAKKGREAAERKRDELIEAINSHELYKVADGVTVAQEAIYISLQTDENEKEAYFCIGAGALFNSHVVTILTSGAGGAAKLEPAEVEKLLDQAINLAVNMMEQVYPD